MNEELKALRLEPGGIYAIECQHNAGQVVMDGLRERLTQEGARLGVTFIVLGPNLKIARADSKVVEA